MVDQNWQNQFLINPFIVAPPAFVPHERVMWSPIGMVMINVTTQNQYVVGMPTLGMVNEDA